MPTNLYGLLEQRPNHPNFGLPFYVGIGGINRPKRHLAEARTAKGHWNSRVDVVMKAHYAVGVEPLIAILSTYAERVDAAVAEIETIARYGRLDIEEGGILCNLAGGGDGPDPAALAIPEVRRRLKEALQASWQDPEVRERRLARLAITNATFTEEQRSIAAHKKSEDGKRRSNDALRAIVSDPEIMARRAENSREPQQQSWLDPVIRAKRTASMTGIKKTMTPEAIAARQATAALPKSDETRALLSETANRSWADPEFRENRSVERLAAWQDPEQRANMLAGRSEGIAASWEDPEVREKRAASLKKAGAKKWANDPEYAAKARAALKASWDDPEKRAARVAKMLASRAEKKAARGAPTPKSEGRSANMKAINAAKTFEERSDMQTALWSDPERAASRNAAMQVAAQDPALKAARLANMLAGKRRKAAARVAEAVQALEC